MDTGTAIGILVALAAAVASGVGAWYTGWQATIAHNASELTKQIHEDQSQPYVYVDIRSDRDQPELIVMLLRNAGPTVATNVRVALDPPVPVDPARGVPPLEEMTVTALPPGAEILRGLGVGADFFDNVARRVSVTVHAKGPHGSVGPLTYDLDMDALALTAIGKKTLNDVADAIAKVAKQTELIARGLDGVASKLGHEGPTRATTVPAQERGRDVGDSEGAPRGTKGT